MTEDSNLSALLRVIMSDFTRALAQIDPEDNAAERLLPLVYEDLRRLAAHCMTQEAPGHTLQPTALVHEAWLRLTEDEDRTWKNQAYFFSAAAQAMRRVLVDHARRKQRVKRGGGMERVNLEGIDTPSQANEDTLLMVHDALAALSAEHSKASELVALRFFAGLSVEESAMSLGVTERTAHRYWRFARAWLLDYISRSHR